MQRKKSTPRSAMTLATFAATILLVSGVADAQTEKILHGFSNNGMGESPYMGLVFDTAGNLYGSLVMDSHGNLYGTTQDGGSGGGGTVFEVTP
jgi:uncharacterized repeat protein (TIGR03803 family)